MRDSWAWPMDREASPRASDHLRGTGTRHLPLPGSGTPGYAEGVPQDRPRGVLQTT